MENDFGEIDIGEIDIGFIRQFPSFSGYARVGYSGASNSLRPAEYRIDDRRKYTFLDR